MAVEYPRSVKARCLRKKVHGYAEPGAHVSNNDDAQITHCWDQIDNEEQPKEWGLQLRTVSDAFQNEFTQHCEILFLHAGIVQILSRVEKIMMSKKQQQQQQKKQKQKLETLSSSEHLLNKSLVNVCDILNISYRTFENEYTSDSYTMNYEWYWGSNMDLFLI